LRQGHADEFTTATPSKRKQVLGNILGLAFYDELEKRARDMTKQREMEIEQLSNNLKEIDDELARLPVYEAEKKQAQDELSHFDESIKGY
jgi:exonuclease SbcC